MQPAINITRYDGTYQCAISECRFTASDDEFLVVTDRFVAAVKAMKDDDWWWQKEGTTNKSIRRGILREVISHRFRQR